MCSDILRFQPPFHEPKAEQYLDEQVAYILPKWIDEAISGRDGDGGYFPAVDVRMVTESRGTTTKRLFASVHQVDAFLSSWLLEPKRGAGRAEIRETFENARNEIRRSF